MITPLRFWEIVGLYKFKSVHVNVDVVICNIHICRMQILVLDTRICIIFFTNCTRAIIAVIICYPYIR